MASKYYHQVWLVWPLFSLCMAIGLVGTRYSLVFALLAAPLVTYLPELLYFVKNHKIRDNPLNRLVYKSDWFLPYIRKIIILGLATGIASNVLLHLNFEWIAITIIAISVILVFFVMANKIQTV
jgi:hypothetical protein